MHQNLYRSRAFFCTPNPQGSSLQRLAELAQVFIRHRIQVIACNDVASMFREAGLTVTSLTEYASRSPDPRDLIVKGVAWRESNATDAHLGVLPIGYLVINLNFEEPDVSNFDCLETAVCKYTGQKEFQAIELAMAAAFNSAHVAVIKCEQSRRKLIEELDTNGGGTSSGFRVKTASETLRLLGNTLQARAFLISLKMRAEASSLELAK